VRCFCGLRGRKTFYYYVKTQNISSLLVAVTDCAGKVERVAVTKQGAVMTAAPVLENQVPKKGKGGRAAI
jgi:hypothetical protein